MNSYLRNVFNIIIVVQFTICSNLCFLYLNPRIHLKMSSPVYLRILFSGDDARKLTLMSGTPASVDELVTEIKTAFGLKQLFRLQYKDCDFGNEFVNLTSTNEIRDRDTLKFHINIFVTLIITMRLHVHLNNENL